MRDVRGVVMRVVMGVVWVVAGGVAAWGQSGSPRQDLWTTNGAVNAIVRTPDTIYIGGAFTQVGPYSGNLVAIDAVSGLSDGLFPMVNGTVEVIIPDGAGGWYAGGTFTGVGGVARNNLARILADGTVDPDFDPNADLMVRALALSNGVLYTGGEFTVIGGVARNHIAALDPETGDATPWNPVSDSFIRTLAISGNTVYLGGNFTEIGGEPRSRIAALDATTGLATSWDPNANSAVNTLVLSGNTVYVGGNFSEIGGEARVGIAALDTSTGSAIEWDANADQAVNVLVLSGGLLYAGGGFRNIGGEARNRIAALDPATAVATSWDPDSSHTVRTLVVSNGLVYVGGVFSSIGGAERNRLAAVDIGTGAATGWNPNANDNVLALAVSGGMVFAGGNFTSLGGVTRNRLAALDADTGVATDWDPNANMEVLALATDGGVVYAGGFFTSIGGESRSRIAALDPVTGAVTAWDPNGSDVVRTLALSGGLVHAGGDFTSIGGETRNRIAALSAATGNATAWNPNANNSVRALAISGGLVYAGGDFTSIGTSARNHIGALDAMTGFATGWNPNSNSSVLALAVSDGVVYAGGQFTSIGGVTRNRIAAINESTGLVTSWNPNSNHWVQALAVSDGLVYAGGLFSNMGGTARNRLAALDIATGIAAPWNPNANGGVNALATAPETVVAGGAFRGMGAGGPAYLTEFPPDMSPPNAIMITPSTTGPTTATSVDFSVVFDEAVVNFDGESDLVISHNGTAHTGVTITGSEHTYTVTVLGLSGEGSFTLAVNTASNVEDFSGNGLASSVTSPAVELIGASAEILVTPENLDFEHVLVGESATMAFTVMNVGDAELSGTAGISGGLGAFSIVGSVDYVIPPGGMTTITIRFEPAEVRTYNGTVTFTGGGGASRPVTGLGAEASAESEISLSDSMLNFGNVMIGDGVTMSVMVSNVGDAQLVGSASITGGADAFEITGGGNYMLAPGAMQAVLVRFEPGSVGLFEATVNFTGGGGAMAMVSGMGVAAPEAVIEVSPSSRDFGEVTTGQSVTMGFVVSNVGDAELVGSASVAGSIAFVVVGGGSYTLAPGAMQEVMVRFEPESVGPFEATVNFTGGGGAMVMVSGMGVATGPSISISPSQNDAGDVAVGESSAVTFMIENTGGSDAVGVLSVSLPFTLVGENGLTVPAGETRSVTVDFAPTVTGSFGGMLRYNGNGFNASATLSGRAVNDPGMLVVSPLELDFGFIPVNTSLDLEVRVENTGGESVNATAMTQPPFSVVDGPMTPLASGAIGVLTIRFRPESAQSSSTGLEFFADGQTVVLRGVGVETTGGVRGRISNGENGQPIGEALIVISGMGGAFNRGTASDVAGEYEFTGVPSGGVDVVVYSPGFEFGVERVVVGTGVEDLDFALNRQTSDATFFGTVLHEMTGRPIGGIQVRLFLDDDDEFFSETFSDAMGSFSLVAPDDVKQGQSTLRADVSGANFEPGTLIGDVDAPELGDIFLRPSGPTGTLSGEVRSMEMEPLSGVRVRTIRGTLTYSAFTDANGLFRFDGLPVGRYDVRASTAVDGVSMAIAVHDGTPPTHVVLRFTGTGTPDVIRRGCSSRSIGMVGGGRLGDWLVMGMVLVVLLGWRGRRAGDRV